MCFGRIKKSKCSYGRVEPRRFRGYSDSSLDAEGNNCPFHLGIRKSRVPSRCPSHRTCPPRPSGRLEGLLQRLLEERPKVHYERPKTSYSTLQKARVAPGCPSWRTCPARGSAPSQRPPSAPSGTANPAANRFRVIAGKGGSKKLLFALPQSTRHTTDTTNCKNNVTTPTTL